VRLHVEEVQVLANGWNYCRPPGIRDAIDFCCSLTAYGALARFCVGPRIVLLRWDRLYAQLIDFEAS